MKKLSQKYVYPALAATLCTGTPLATGADTAKAVKGKKAAAPAKAGDGSTEPGFVHPPVSKKLPPAPPRTVSSAESFEACCCCPITPMARTEAKKPPKPPTLVTKLKEK